MLIKELLATTGHRPWPLPAGRFSWYQEWNRLLFFHFRIDAAIIRPLVPAGVQADTFDGSAWVSLVPFTMNRIRPRLTTHFPPVSDFHEVNLRTYVTDGKQAGVYFFSLEASRWLPTWLARSISGMPYETAAVTRTSGATDRYQVKNMRKNTFLSVGYRPGTVIEQKTGLQRWLTERYCTYLYKNNSLYRFQVHHIPWPLMAPDLQDVQLEYRVGGQLITEKDIVSVQYSPGVQVLAWGRETL